MTSLRDLVIKYICENAEHFVLQQPAEVPASASASAPAAASNKQNKKQHHAAQPAATANASQHKGRSSAPKPITRNGRGRSSSSQGAANSYEDDDLKQLERYYQQALVDADDYNDDDYDDENELSSLDSIVFHESPAAAASSVSPKRPGSFGSFGAAQTAAAAAASAAACGLMTHCIPLFSILPMRLAQQILNELCANQLMTLQLLKSLSVCTGLSQLNLSGCGRVANEWMYTIRTMRLCSLNLSHCLIDNSGLSNFYNSRKIAAANGTSSADLSSRDAFPVSETLTSLNLSFVSQMTCDGLLHVCRAFPVLRTLSLEGCHRLTNKAFEIISQKLASSLTALNMRKCSGITAHGIKSLQGTAVEVLNLSACPKLGSDIFKILASGDPSLTQQLVYLNLSKNPQLRGGSVKMLGAMQRIRTLDLYGIERIQELSWLLDSACSLTSLNVSKAEIIHVDELMVLASLDKLKCLNLCGIRLRSSAGGASLGDVLARVITALPLLEALNLSNTEINDETLLSIGKHAVMLQKLDISFCRFVTDAGFRAFDTLKELQDLHVQGLSQIGPSGWLRVYKNLPKLSILDMGRCFVEFEDDSVRDDRLDTWASIAQRTQGNLEAIALQGCSSFGDDQLILLSSSSVIVSSLVCLDVSGTNVSLYGLAHGMQKLVNLKSLNMVGCHLMDDGASSTASSSTNVSEDGASSSNGVPRVPHIGSFLCPLQRLEHLDLTDVREFGNDDLRVISCLKLRELSISGTGVTNRGIMQYMDRLRFLVKLEIFGLDISDRSVHVLSRLINLNSLGISTGPQLSERGLEMLQSEKLFPNLIYLKLRENYVPFDFEQQPLEAEI